MTHFALGRFLGVAALAGASGLILAGCNRDLAPLTATPHTSVNALMVGMVDNAGHVLWDVEKPEAAPKTDADWLEIEEHATQLVVAGTLIQLGGTGQADPGWARQVGWKTSAEAMSDAALAALTAAKAKNLDALIKANGDLVDSCLACHKAFKPELPTEGIIHHRPHSETH